MKTIYLLLATFALSGCAVYDAYFMAKFDPNEYQYITRIRTHAELGLPLCGTPDVREHVKYIWVTATEYRNYAEDLPKNEDSYKLASTLITITDEFYKRYQGDTAPSTMYCHAKFTAIKQSSENIQKVIGAKPR
jgi:hypothetical protein